MKILLLIIAILIFPCLSSAQLPSVYDLSSLWGKDQYEVRAFMLGSPGWKLKHDTLIQKDDCRIMAFQSMTDPVLIFYFLDAGKAERCTLSIGTTDIYSDPANQWTNKLPSKKRNEWYERNTNTVIIREYDGNFIEYKLYNLSD